MILVMRGPRTGDRIFDGGLFRCPCTARQGDGARYRLARAVRPVPLERFLADLALRYGTAPRPAAGVLWTRAEFARQQWVAEWAADAPEGERFRDAVLAAHGDRIPADLAVLEALALDFQGIETPGREASWVRESHVLDFAGVTDLSVALHLLYRADWIVPLCDGTVVAPRLVLAPAGPGRPRTDHSH